MEGILSVESHNFLESHKFAKFLPSYLLKLSFTTKNIFNDLAANKLFLNIGIEKSFKFVQSKKLETIKEFVPQRLKLLTFTILTPISGNCHFRSP